MMSFKMVPPARLNNDAAELTHTSPGPSSASSSSAARRCTRSTLTTVAGVSAPSSPVLAQGLSSSPVLTTVWPKPARPRSRAINSPRRPSASSSSSIGEVDGSSSTQQHHPRSNHGPLQLQMPRLQSSYAIAPRPSARSSSSAGGVNGASRASSGCPSLTNLSTDATPHPLLSTLHSGQTEDRAAEATAAASISSSSARRTLNRPLLLHRTSVELRSGNHHHHHKNRHHRASACAEETSTRSRASSSSVRQQARRTVLRTASTEADADAATTSSNGSSHLASTIPRKGGERTLNRHVPQQQQHTPEAHLPSSRDSSLASSPLLHPADAPLSSTLPRGALGPTLLSSAVPILRSPPPIVESGSVSGDDPKAAAATTTAAAAVAGPSGLLSPTYTASRDKDGRSFSSRRADSGAVDSSKPWLQKPEGRGILKQRSSARWRTGSIVIASTPTAKGLARNVHADPAAAADAPPPALSAPTPGGPAAVHITSLQSARASRHVRFDEANIEYLDASANHVIHRDSQLGVKLDNVAWGAMMLSPTTAAQAAGTQRRAESGTAVSMGKVKPSAWGADSEWFNEQFEAQMEPHADHSNLSSPAITPEVLGAQSAAAAAAASSPPSEPARKADVSRRRKTRSKRANGGVRRRHSSSDRLDGASSHKADLRGATFPAPRRGSGERRGAAAEESEAALSPPLLAYDRASLIATVGAMGSRPSQTPPQPVRTLSPVSPRSTPRSASSANDAFVPAPPLSVDALGHRTALSSAVTSPSPQSSLADIRGRSTGSRPRLSSPGASFNRVDLTALQMDDDDRSNSTANHATNDVAVLLTGDACTSPRPIVIATPRQSTAGRNNGGGGGDGTAAEASGDFDEVPSQQMLQLSETERRLLRAVMHVNQRGRSTPRTPETPSQQQSGATGSSNRALRASVRTLGQLRADVLSSGI